MASIESAIQDTMKRYIYQFDEKVLILYSLMKNIKIRKIKITGSLRSKREVIAPLLASPKSMIRTKIFSFSSPYRWSMS